jgi:hypothetical protein
MSHLKKPGAKIVNKINRAIKCIYEQKQLKHLHANNRALGNADG